MPSLARSQRSRTPVYQPMLDDIRNEIKKQKLVSGEWLASESSLGESYGISRISVRRALSILCEEGLIQAVAGKGYQVLQDRASIGLKEVIILCPASYIDDNTDTHYYGLMRRCVSDALMKHDIFVKTMGHPHNVPSVGYWESVNFPATSGVMFMAETSTHALPPLHQIQGPILQLDHRLPSISQDSIELDCAQEGEQMVDHLVNLGHRNIGFIDWVRGEELNPERKSGVLKGLSRNGLRLDPRLSAAIPMSEKSAYQATKEFLSSGAEFTAVITYASCAAHGVIHALESEGLSVPKDVSVGSLSLDLDPHVGALDITRSELNMVDFAHAAVERILHRHKHPKESAQSVYLPMHLHVGESTTQAK